MFIGLTVLSSLFYNSNLKYQFCKLGVSICINRVSLETLNLNKKKADLDSRENLNTFKILVSTIENSWSRSRFLNLVSMAICKSITSRSRSRLIETCQDFSSQPYLFTFCASKLASKWAKSAGKKHGYLDLSR